jgi:hypothetical protein
VLRPITLCATGHAAAGMRDPGRSIINESSECDTNVTSDSDEEEAVMVDDGGGVGSVRGEAMMG